MLNTSQFAVSRNILAILVVYILALCPYLVNLSHADPRPGIAEIIENIGPIEEPAARQEVVEAIRALQAERRSAGESRALELGLPLRRDRPDGVVKEVADVDELGHPVYFITHNDMAAISTGVDQVHLEPYGMSGGGVVIGIWDGGAVRSSHQEFSGGRVTILDGSSPISHATHVGGTLAATGVVAQAKGMAFAATLNSYDWNDDKAEMTDRAATSPGDPDKLYLSNHSYGFIVGWHRTGGSDPAYIWYGSGTDADSSDPRFGQYNTHTRDSDVIAYNAPYYLMFRSAGNDRIDNPTAGQTVQLSPSRPTTVTYDPALHPAGDGLYRGGYGTISFDAVAKNVITIGSVADAVTSGARDMSKAEVSNFSSWGPADDGRIKPDLVANGESLYSTLSGSDTSYGRMSGTSMSTPNATGTAALLIEEYQRLFPGGAMRASTFKALLIHTADDLGNPGPDYRYGWGLLNVANAIDLIHDHALYPEKNRMIEDHLTTNITSQVYEFVWDGSSPIRATLCWTDPAGAATTSANLRSPRLRNNLDLQIIGPGNQSFFPYVMPFVGTWTEESMSEPATTGINNTDNIEQVYIDSPPSAGVYRAVVTYQGSLTDNQQVFSLLIDGASGEDPPPPSLSIQSVSPEFAYVGGTATMEISGTALATTTDLRLLRTGFADLIAFNLRLSGDRLLGDFDLSNAATGAWSIQVANETETSLLEDGFNVVGALWSENFDGTIGEWNSIVIEDHSGNAWNLTSDHSHSSPTSYFAPAPSTRTTTALESPPIDIPENASDLQLRFWHHYDLQQSRDGGRLYFSINGGEWTGIDEIHSGAAFASNGYTGTIRTTGRPDNRSYFHGNSAWTGNSGGFIESLVNFTDTEKFTGNSMRLRWILATDNSIASPGWYVDSIVLLGNGDLDNQPPQIIGPIEVIDAEIVTENEQSIYLVDDSEAALTVEASDDGGLENLTYSWSASGPAPVFFMPDNSLNASSTTAYFETLGDYTLSVAVKDADGLTTGDSAMVRVLAASTALQLSPSSITIRIGESVQLSATLLDQFNDPMEDQPEFFSWATTGGGSIDGNGLFLADTAGENYSISATYEDISDFALVTILKGIASVTLSDLDDFYDGSPKSATVTTDPTGLAYIITYDDEPDAPVNAGSYEVVAEIDDLNYEGYTSAIMVINQADATVWLDNLEHVYDGSPKSATVTTDPAGLAYIITYDDEPDAPVNAGIYEVVAEIDETNYHGTVTATLVIDAVTASGIPFSWLEEHGLPTDGSMDHERIGDSPFTVWEEWRAGTNPNDINDILRIIEPPTRTPDGVIVRWRSVDNRTYTVERSQNLTGDPQFYWLATGIQGIDGISEYVDDSADGSGPFLYRVMVE